MAHPLVLALYDTTDRATAAVAAVRRSGVAQEHISIVAASHDEETLLARASGATPGVDLEDSRPVARLAELSAHVLALVATVLPGVGPVLAGGPLAAELGEAAGHVAGGLVHTLVSAGVPEPQAESWLRSIEAGAIIVAVHVVDADEARTTECLRAERPVDHARGTWTRDG
jgi:hypothetical protein